MMKLEDLGIEELVELKAKLGDAGRERIDLLLRKKRGELWVDRSPRVHVLPIIPRPEPRTWNDPHWRQLRHSPKALRYTAFVEDVRKFAHDNDISVQGECRALFNLPMKASLHKAIRKRMRGTPHKRQADRLSSYVKGVAWALDIEPERIHGSLVWADEGSLVLEVLP